MSPRAPTAPRSSTACSTSSTRLAWLERWPSADRRSRLVVIGRNLRQAWVEALLDALEAEVGEVARG